MINVTRIDDIRTREVTLVLGKAVECAYPGCVRHFVPIGAARRAYAQKGYCYCFDHQMVVATFYATRRSPRKGK